MYKILRKITCLANNLQIVPAWNIIFIKSCLLDTLKKKVCQQSCSTYNLVIQSCLFCMGFGKYHYR